MSIESFYGDLPVPPAIEIEPILPDFLEHVQRALEAHGGRLEGQRAYFPAGTFKRFVWPPAMDSRYDLYFPDGYCVLLIETRQGRNLIGINSVEYPESLKQKYPEMFPPG